MSRTVLGEIRGEIPLIYSTGRLTEAIDTTTADYVKEQNQLPEKHRVSVSGVLRHLGVSRSGYHAWLCRLPSAQQRRKEQLKEKIQQIHEESHQIYGVPKIADKLQKHEERVTAKTVGNYMREMGLWAHWVKPYIQTMIDSDFRDSLQNILDEQFNPEEPNAV